MKLIQIEMQSNCIYLSAKSQQNVLMSVQHNRPAGLHSALTLTALALFATAMLAGVACGPAQNERAPEGYELEAALEFIPRGYECDGPCRCLEFYTLAETGPDAKRPVRQVLLWLRGFTSPEGERKLERCRPETAVGYCTVHATLILPEQAKPPDMYLIWYDSPEIGLENARAGCISGGFVEF